MIEMAEKDLEELKIKKQDYENETLPTDRNVRGVFQSHYGTD